MNTNTTDAQTTPSITLAHLKNVIPSHCWVRDEWRFLQSVAWSVLSTVVITITAWCVLPAPHWSFLSMAAWMVYALVQGTIVVGVWELGHECGHYAMSTHEWVNDVCGWILHSVVLVPYFMFRHSHAIHHAHPNRVDVGESHVPFVLHTKLLATTWASTFTSLRGNRVAAVLRSIELLIGWPLYLL
jgi:omega-6 fatty acid desaturase (delta-12 desaturase)